MSPAVYRRRRITVAAVAVALVALIAYAGVGRSSGHHTSSSKGSSTTGAKAGQAAARPVTPPHLSVALASWQLPVPLSRTVALAVDGSLDVFGGLTGTGNSTSGQILKMDPATGHSEQLDTLPTPVHDAAGGALGGRYFVFGGGASALTANVQSFAPDTPQGSAPTGVAGQLPTPRADLSAANGPDGTVYLAGGYDGRNFSVDVLSTRDGKQFKVVGQLAVPVRYPAVAVSGHQLLVIGGETGPSATSATMADTPDIQAVDLKTGQTTVAGQLPAGLSHASAVALGGSVYVFGGRSAGKVVADVWKLAPTSAPAGGALVSATAVGHLPLPLSDMAVATFGESAYLVGGEGQLGQPGTSVIVARWVTAPGSPSPGVAAAAFTGRLLIADRGNDRLVLVNADKQVLWTFPSAAHPAPAAGFYFPDDAFFAKSGTAIITNQEDQNTIEELAFPSGALIAMYGHPNVAGAGPGYLSQPDDAFLLKNGDVTVADAKNCRILFLNPDFTYLSAIGHTGRCRHDIPNDVAYPNGDTPLPDGNFLVSEILGSYVDEVTMSGQVIWSLKLPIAYPSDPQQLGPDLYLIADYSRPGGIYEFAREGQIVWSYKVASGEGMLDHPSLAERLPNGLIAANDDYRHRVVIINPATGQIVWQYGDTDSSGTAPGLLNTPDGFDLLMPDGTTPTHPTTG